MEAEEATRWFAISTTIGTVLIAVISPILGTMADFNGRKKRMLGGFMAPGVRSVAAMFFIYQGDWILASILFILANIGANGSFVFYDALLPHIASDEEVDRVSTAGYALGYLGGGLLLALNLAWITKPAWFGLPAGDGSDTRRIRSGCDSRSSRWRSGGSSSRSPCSAAYRSLRVPVYRRDIEPGRSSRSERRSTSRRDRSQPAPLSSGRADAPGVPDLQ